jgi:D-serine deaminase-like pyridoxal phosphate-dependent protein
LIKTDENQGHFMLFPELDTPALIIEKKILLNNIQSMQALADNNNISLRPHVKTHKMPFIAEIQKKHGARGIACAKLGEAEIMSENGFDDILLANIIIGPNKLNRLAALIAKGVKIRTCVDNPDQAKALEEFFTGTDYSAEVLIEFDTGFGRTGVSDLNKFRELAQYVISLNSVDLKGVMSHAGEVYHADDVKTIQKAAQNEADVLIKIKEILSSIGLQNPVVSLGSTPSARHSILKDLATELRVGNYVFHDMIQVSLGTCSQSNCALSVLGTVISTPEPTRAVTDCGSKALTQEKGAHGARGIEGHGKVVGSEAEIVRLSEEHGIIKCSENEFKIGERVRIIPNHACTCTNLYDYAYLVDGEEVLEKIPITCRGKSQ